MDIRAIMARLKAEVPALREIGTLIKVDPDKPPAQTPAAYVIPSRDQAEPNRHATGRHSQPFHELFGVLLIHRHPGGEDRAVLELEAHKSAIRLALMGWVPGPGYGAVDYVSGALVHVGEGGELWWLMQFSTSSLLTR